MTKNAARKKTVRERMAATGEPYMQARRETPTADSPAEAATAWVIHQSTGDPRDPKPHPWVLHSDGTTHGFVDHGRLLGYLTDPDNPRSLTPVGKNLTDLTVQQMVGGHLVTFDRFTGQMAVWQAPVTETYPALPADERERLDGGTLDHPAARQHDADRAGRRAAADTRIDRDTGPYLDTIVLANGTVLDVGATGTTIEGLIAGFGTGDADPVDWPVVDTIVGRGGDVQWLVGMDVVVFPDDLSERSLGAIAKITVADE